MAEISVDVDPLSAANSNVAGNNDGSGMISFIDYTDFGAIFNQAPYTEYSGLAAGFAFTPVSGYLLVAAVISGQLWLAAVRPLDMKVMKRVNTGLDGVQTLAQVNVVYSAKAKKAYLVITNAAFDSKLIEVNPRTLATAAIVTLAAADPLTQWVALCYSPVDGKILCGTLWSSTPNNLVQTWDPATATASAQVSIGVTDPVGGAVYFPAADRYAVTTGGIPPKTIFITRDLGTLNTYTHLGALPVAYGPPLFVPVGSRVWVGITDGVSIHWDLMKKNFTLDVAITTTVFPFCALFCRGNGLVVNLCSQSGSAHYSTVDPVDKAEVMAGLADASVNDVPRTVIAYVPGLQLLFAMVSTIYVGGQLMLGRFSV